MNLAALNLSSASTVAPAVNDAFPEARRATAPATAPAMSSRGLNRKMLKVDRVPFTIRDGAHARGEQLKKASSY